LVRINSLGLSILKYAEKIDSKVEIDCLDGNRFKKLVKKITLEMYFECQIYDPFHKVIKGYQGATWQVEVGPHGNGCIMMLMSKSKFSSFSNFTYKFTFTMKLFYKLKLHVKNNLRKEH
jgi:hypothetical protein